MVGHSLANSIYPRVNNPQTMHIPTVTSVIPISYQAEQVQPQNLSGSDRSNNSCMVWSLCIVLDDKSIQRRGG